MTKRFPNFFLIGAAKSGTTSLHRLLSAHPNIYMSPIKETNFFSQSDMNKTLFLRTYQNSVKIDLDRYLRGPMTKSIHIADIKKWDDYVRLFRDIRGESIIGEASNSYLFCPSTAENIFKRTPKAKILAILRNPIERAWSHYLMNYRLGYTVSNNFIDEFTRDSNQIYKGWGVSHNYRDLGMYSTQLKRYYSVFPRDQIKIVIYDSYRDSPETTLTNIFNFLNLNPSLNIDTTIRENRASMPRSHILNSLLFRSTIFTRLRHASPPKVIQIGKKLLLKSSSGRKPECSEIDFLRDVYADEIIQLSQEINRDLRHWNTFSS